jgi:Zn-dependent protease
MGDMTAKRAGRLTLNPLAHLDPIGTLMILFGPIGWAKPVPVDPYAAEDAGKFMLISTAFGPLSNIAQGLLWGTVLRIYLAVTPTLRVDGNVLLAFLAMATLINYVLALFNLIPLGPLDGTHIWPYFLPYSSKVRFHRFNRQYGMFVLFGLIAAGFMFNLPILSFVVFLPADSAASLIAGVPSCWNLFWAAIS